MWRVVKMVAWSIVVCGSCMFYYPFTGVAQTRGNAGTAEVRWTARPPACTAVPPTLAVREGSAAAKPQVLYDARSQATFSARFNGQGSAVLTARGGELEMEKTISPDGRSRLDLKAGQDAVSFALNQASIDITRDNHTLHFELSQMSDEDALTVKRFIAGSKSVRLLRVLASNLDPATLKTPAGVSTLLADAFVGQLDGDVTAIDRLARYFASRKLANVRRVSARDEGPGCYEKYEAEIVRAWNDYTACYWEVGWMPGLRELCGYRWMLWVESSWFSFLGCSMFPFMRIE